MLKEVLNIFFPLICPLCRSGLVERGLCGACLGTIKKIQGPLCTHCGTPFGSGAGGDHLCGECLEGGAPFVKARSAVFYEGRALEAIHLLKYGGRLRLARPLGRMAGDAASGLVEDGHPGLDVVMPVPLHKTRLRERGFNQSLLLAREVAGPLGLELDYTSLGRTRPTVPQVDLTKAERLKNVRGAFTVRSPEAVRKKRVLLVDDVFTSGATVRECSKVLGKAGAVVYVVTLARVVRF